jgi:hypothetical protein
MSLSRVGAFGAAAAMSPSRVNAVGAEVAR